MGKSTFINLLSRKQVAQAKKSHKPVTENMNEYKIYKIIGDKKIGIIFYDTPGLTDDKNDENIKIIDLIKTKLNNDIDSVEQIHLIYFFLNDSTNLGNHILFFQLLVNINKEREKKKYKKIPIIFVYNMNSEDDIDKDLLKSFLNDDKNDFHSLYIENIPGFQNGESSENDNIIITNLKKKKTLGSMFQFLEFKNY